jgi:uncharacterized protein (AIM24 family)
MDVNLKTPGIVDITLKPREIFYAERGAMSFCDGGIIYAPIDTGFLKSLKRWLGGESFYSIVKFENTSNSLQNLKLRYDVQQNAWFHHNSTNTDIIYLDLKKMYGELIVQPGAFFAATEGVGVDVYYDSNWGRSILGFGKIFKQRIYGSGTVFIQKNRWLQLNEMHIESGKTITIDPKEVYAYTLKALLNDKKFSFGNFRVGEGFSSYKFQGPGVVFTYKNKPAYSDVSGGGIFRWMILFFIGYIIVRIIF